MAQVPSSKPALSEMGFLGAVGKYTKFVHVSKWALAGVVAVVGVTMLVIPTLRSKEDRVNLAFSGVENKDGDSSPTMLNPKLQGVDKQKQPFMVTAKTARQLDTNTVELQDMQADMTLKGEKWLTVFARQGILKLNEELLNLNGKVELYHEGYEMKTEQVTVHLNDSTAENNTSVEGQGPMGRIKAARFTVFDRGNRIVFNGGVTMTVYPGSDT
ncbi:MAG: LPS export ABC transporter periplasmic protein LptC [Rickettsiales bacterium]